MNYFYALVLAVGMAIVFTAPPKAQTPQPAAVTASSASVSIKLIGTGIATISPKSCTFVGGPGSANQQVCQLSASTIPAGGTVTWALNGGPNAALFVMSPSGMISSGPADISPGNYAVFVQATAH
jgi:hypothetical protein